MHYLITGHTGFKGTWLSLMLKELGHEVSGISLAPENSSLFKITNIEELFVHNTYLDINNRDVLDAEFKKINPDIVVHLAAQPLVSEGYKHPIETYETNVIGTLNVLNAASSISHLKAALVITTDKVYKNLETTQPYVESDALGGFDPYSSSKAAADIATQSWRDSFPQNFPIAIARAGNVIGGGDWAANRIIPDLMNSIAKGEKLTLRYPEAIRPWQHVLDCLYGYLTLINKMIDNGIQGEWNFGPDTQTPKNVSELVDAISSQLGLSEKLWLAPNSEVKHEAGLLLLNSTKARRELNWSDHLDFDETIRWTADWYMSDEEPLERTQKQILDYLNL